MGLPIAICGLVFLFFAGVAIVAGSVPWTYAHLALGVVCLLYAGFTSAGELRGFLGRDASRRGARHGGNTVLQTVLAVVILGVIAWLSVRHPVRWDWTEAGVHSLSPATVEVLEEIPADTPVEILAFYTPGSEVAAKAVLDRYTYRSDRVRVQVVDPNARPDLATRHEVRTNGVLIVCGGDCQSAKGTARLTAATEEELTKAIRSVISRRRKIYFLTGHGEASLEDANADGVSRAKLALEDENLQVEPLLLANLEDVPDDADAVFVASPDRSLLARELDALERYLRGGGSLLVLTDPFRVSNLLNRVETWGVRIGNDLIVDQQIQLFAGPRLGVQPIVTAYGTHPITEEMAERPTLFHLARSVRSGDEADAEDAVELVSSGDGSWAETDLARFLEESRVGLDAEDLRGPVPLAVAKTFAVSGDEQQEGRLVVIGDSDFARNRYLAELFNVDLFLNVANWLVGEEAFITIERSQPRATRVVMTPEQFSNFRYLSLFVLPEMIILAGILIWWGRRT